MITVRLSRRELLLAAVFGASKQVDKVVERASPAHGLAQATSDTAWNYSINGALAELAVAKYLGRFWNGPSAKGAIDVCGIIDGVNAEDAFGVEVRYRSRDGNDLTLYPDDRDDLPFVLVTGTAPDFVLRGWMRAVDGKRPEYWNAPGGRFAYWIPQAALCSMESLPDYLRRMEGPNGGPVFLLDASDRVR